MMSGPRVAECGAVKCSAFLSCSQAFQDGCQAEQHTFTGVHGDASSPCCCAGKMLFVFHMRLFSMES